MARNYQHQPQQVKQHVPAGESQHRPRPNPWRATNPDQYRWDRLGRKWRQNQRDCRELMIAQYVCGTTATIDRLANFLHWSRDRVKRTLRDCERLGCLVRGEKIGRWVTRGGITFFHCTGVRRHLRLAALLPGRKSESAPQAPRMCTEEVPESFKNRTKQETHATAAAKPAASVVRDTPRSTPDQELIKIAAGICHSTDWPSCRRFTECVAAYERIAIGTIRYLFRHCTRRADGDWLTPTGAPLRNPVSYFRRAYSRFIRNENQNMQRAVVEKYEAAAPRRQRGAGSSDVFRRYAEREAHGYDE